MTLARTPVLALASVVFTEDLGVVVGSTEGELLSFDGEDFQRLGSEPVASGAWAMVKLGPRIVYSGPVLKAIGQYTAVEYCELQYIYIYTYISVIYLKGELQICEKM